MPNLVNAKLHSLFGIGTGRNVPEEHVESVVDAVVEELVGDDDDNE